MLSAKRPLSPNPLSPSEMEKGGFFTAHRMDSPSLAWLERGHKARGRVTDPPLQKTGRLAAGGLFRDGYGRMIGGRGVAAVVFDAQQGGDRESGETHQDA